LPIHLTLIDPEQLQPQGLIGYAQGRDLIPPKLTEEILRTRTTKQVQQQEQPQILRLPSLRFGRSG